MDQKEFASRAHQFVDYYYGDPANMCSPKSDITEHFFGTTPESHIASYTGHRVVVGKKDAVSFQLDKTTIILTADTNKKTHDLKFEGELPLKETVELGVGTLAVTRDLRAATLNGTALSQPNPGGWFGNLAKIKKGEFPAKG